MRDKKFITDIPILINRLEDIINTIPLEFCEEIKKPENECARCNLQYLIDDLKLIYFYERTSS